MRGGLFGLFHHRAYMRGTFTSQKTHPAPLQTLFAAARDDIVLPFSLYYAVEFVATDKQGVAFWVAEAVNLKVDIK